MHIYSKDQQAFHLQRTVAERWWSRVNTFIVVVQLACFLSVVIRTASGASNSMTNNFFTYSALSLKAPYIVPNCVFNVSRRHAFFNNVHYTMSRDNVGYFVSRAALNIRFLIAITGVHVVLSATNRLWFETNTHEIRYHFVVFRKDMVTTWETLLMVLGFVVTLGIVEENRIMTEYINFCSSSNAVNSVFYNSVQPYTELMVSYIISMAATVANGAFAVWNLSKKNPLDAMLRETKRQQEAWKKEVQQYYGEGQPDPATAAAAAAMQSEGYAGGAQPQVTYADNRAATVNLNTGAAGTLPKDVNGPAETDKAGQPQRHRHSYRDTIRKGLGQRFTAISSSLRRRAHVEDELNPTERQPPVGLAPPPEQPHVGPSVSRPFTPLLNEEYDQAVTPETLEQREGEGAIGDRLGLVTNRIGGNSGIMDSSTSGRYDLHEVNDDEDDERGAAVVTNVASSYPNGVQVSSSAGDDAGGATGFRRGRGMSSSDASTALVAARLAAVPPPPPVYSGDDRRRAPARRGKMLAPPSPLQGGAETTDDTVHVQ
ncbi:hypothetical protein LSCM1_04759 [Leishmania martiniquensis]|uniref:Transmembrane protein n=1 Tax=Leishmania martiniquensis TaxID=1580590 RepID=A0A836KL03_9TRYP|nr:hypothetical protein LSCM1_04759 [Leishmania martiniquensis]